MTSHGTAWRSFDARTAGASLQANRTNSRAAGCGTGIQQPRGLPRPSPRASSSREQTKYLDEALHVDARHERVSPPLLGSRIRNDMLRAFLAPRPGELVVDLGCGSGRALLWNRDLGATMVGIDIAPFFSHDARREIDLMLGDLRKLPFADSTFDKAWSLDVLEHLSPDALEGMLDGGEPRAQAGRRTVRLHARAQERADRRRPEVDQLAGAAAWSAGT